MGDLLIHLTQLQARRRKALPMAPARRSRDPMHEAVDAESPAKSLPDADAARQASARRSLQEALHAFELDDALLRERDEADDDDSRSSANTTSLGDEMSQACSTFDEEALVQLVQRFNRCLCLSACSGLGAAAFCGASLTKHCPTLCARPPIPAV